MSPWRKSGQDSVCRAADLFTPAPGGCVSGCLGSRATSTPIQTGLHAGQEVTGLLRGREPRGRLSLRLVGQWLPPGAESLASVSVQCVVSVSPPPTRSTVCTSGRSEQPWAAHWLAAPGALWGWRREDTRTPPALPGAASGLVLSTGWLPFGPVKQKSRWPQC